MKITNIANGPRGFWRQGRLIVVPPGETVEHDMAGGDLAGLKGNPEAFSTDAEAEIVAPDYAVSEKSPGWFVITKDGESVTKSLRKDDVEGFDAMSDEDKGAFVDLNKAD